MLFTRKMVKPLALVVLSPLLVGLTLCTYVAQALYELIKDRDSRSGLSDSALKWPKD